jgi:ribosomal protein S18 acetylase RimI-like enzyme
MSDYIIDAYKDEYLKSIIEFWNRNFENERNFFPITEEIFKKRVIDKKTAMEKFEPQNFLLAVKQQKVIGIIHVGINSEEFCKAVYPDWPGGTQGYVAFFYVDKDHRLKGVGGNLWLRAMKQLHEADSIKIDTQCINPFYGNSEGPFTPFWGTPEGIGIKANDQPTLEFLARRGFVPKYNAIQFEFDFANFNEVVLKQANRFFEREKLEVKVIEEYPELGIPVSEVTRKFSEKYKYWCAVCFEKDIPVSYISFYPMKEVSESKFAIYEVITLEKYQGRGIGSNLLKLALARMKQEGAKTCDAVTIREISPSAYWMYISAGFNEVEQWAIF